MVPDVVQGVLIDCHDLWRSDFRHSCQLHVGDELRRGREVSTDHLGDRDGGARLDQLDDVAQHVDVVLDGVRGLDAGAGAGEAALPIIG